MKIIAFSDSHGSDSFMKAVIDNNLVDTECFFHLGDGCESFAFYASYYPEHAFVAVRGNCDSGCTPAEAVLDMGGFRFFLTHGSMYDVKSGMAGLVHAAAERNCDIAMFGHTHTPYSEYLSCEALLSRFSVKRERPMYLFNPGSIGLPGSGPPQFGICEIKNGILLTNAVYNK